MIHRLVEYPGFRLRWWRNHYASPCDGKIEETATAQNHKVRVTINVQRLARVAPARETLIAKRCCKKVW